MILYNSYRNLFKFVLLILFCNFCQPTTPKSQHQIEFFKTAQEMLESAPNAIFEANLAADGIDGISITKWLYKYSGVMCSENFDAKIEKDGQNDILDGKIFENFKTIRNNLCKELNNGKDMEKAVKKVENLSINVLEYFGNNQKTKIMQKFVQINGQTIQKGVNNVFYGFLSKLKIEKLVKNFDLELTTFFDALTGTVEKDDSSCTQRQNVDAAKFLIQRRRRRKRMERITNPFDIEQAGGEAPSTRSSNPHTYTLRTPLACAFFAAVGAIALVVMMYPFNNLFYGDAAPKFVALFVMALLLLFAAIGSFIYHRCACYMVFRIRYLTNRPPI
ncbi:hypothetical protein GPALN_014870 [Globodera pallida]|nr:hypothetical protein GPALN_014870 [Globodera pallida]